MTNKLRFILVLAMTFACANIAAAQAIGFVNNQNSNSVDFFGAVGSNGGILNTTINFDTALLGLLQSTLYAPLGVNLAATGIFSTVVSGVGPSQVGTTAPRSFGEGIHPESKYLGTPGDFQSTGCFAPGCGGSLTISFALPVLAVGLFTIDLYNPPSAPHVVTLEAFTGQNGTGASLGRFSSASFNFQQNAMYFMGVLSPAGNIGSVVFNDPNDAVNGDVIGIDNILFAPAPGRMVPPPIDVSGKVSVTQNGFGRNRATGLYVATMTVKNTSNTTINGPIEVVLAVLSQRTYPTAIALSSS